MSERDKRQKASDVFKESNFLFAEKTSSFEKAFPQIEDLRVEVQQMGHRIHNYHREKCIYNKETLPGEFINCDNPICYNGGLSIGAILREMVRKNQTELEKNEICQGYEGSPKGRRKYGKCVNYFNIKVSIKYKE